MTSESKLDDSFAEALLLIAGYGKQFRLDRSRNSGGIMFLNQSDILREVISTGENPFERFYVELSLRKEKW